MTCKNVSHCLLVLARNKLLQETHAFHIFQLKEKILQPFSVLMWGITRMKPMPNTGKKCKFCENTKALACETCLFSPTALQSLAVFLMPECLCFLKTSPAG